jgi:hypothetical protein
MNKTTGTRTDEPTFMEFLARRGEEVIALSESSGKDRSSTERILQRPEDDRLNFPWPPNMNQSKKRQTVHASWTLQKGVASDGRTVERSHPGASL